MRVGDTDSARGSDLAVQRPSRAAKSGRFPRILSLVLAAAALAATPSALAQDEVEKLPLNLPAEAAPGGSSGASAKGADIGRLGDALQQMKVENPVVARVNGHEIRWAAVIDSADDLPERYRDQLETVFPALLDRLVDMHLLADAARGQGLQEDPALREKMASYEDRLLSDLLLERYLDDRVTTAEVRKRYDAMVALRRANLEVRARHILVPSEEEAEAIIAKLDDGAVFLTLARESSIGASAERGGDLGYFFSRRMAPEFAAALDALEPGSYTTSPVKTEFGWHVILLVDRRDDDIPSFIDMQAQLREELTKEMVGQLIASLRQQASLEMFPEDAATPDEPSEGSDK